MARSSYVVSPYNSLTTYATYDTRNRLPIDVACDMRPLCSCCVILKFLEKRSERGPRNTYGQKRLMTGCGRGIKRSYSVHTTFPQRPYGVYDALTARKIMRQPDHGALTARIQRYHGAHLSFFYILRNTFLRI